MYAKVKAQALALPRRQRERLISELDDSLDDDPEVVAKAWKGEIQRRVKAIRSGRVKPVPLHEALGRLDTAIARKRDARGRGRARS